MRESDLKMLLGAQQVAWVWWRLCCRVTLQCAFKLSVQLKYISLEGGIPAELEQVHFPRENLSVRLISTKMCAPDVSCLFIMVCTQQSNPLISSGISEFGERERDAADRHPHTPISVILPTVSRKISPSQ